MLRTKTSIREIAFYQEIKNLRLLLKISNNDGCQFFVFVCLVLFIFAAMNQSLKTVANISDDFLLTNSQDCDVCSKVSLQMVSIFNKAIICRAFSHN